MIDSTHPTLEELTMAVHGLAPAPDHLQHCAECLETAGRLRDERDLLRRAETRLAVPAPKLRSGGAVLLAIAAATLLAITALITLQPGQPAPAPSTGSVQSTPDVDALTARLFEAGEPEIDRVREALLKEGPSILPALVKARFDRHGKALRPEKVALLFLELKEKGAGPAARPLFKKLKEVVLSVDFKDTPVRNAVDFYAQTAGINLCVDPELKAALPVSVKNTNASLGACIDDVARKLDLEWDVRAGVILLAKPERLFDLPQKAGAPAAVIPREGEWRRQILDEKDAALLKKLDGLPLEVSFEEAPLTEALAFVKGLAELPLILEAGFPPPDVTLKVRGLRASDFLELLTLLHGWDLQFRNGALLVFKRRS